MYRRIALIQNTFKKSVAKIYFVFVAKIYFVFEVNFYPIFTLFLPYFIATLFCKKVFFCKKVLNKFKTKIKGIKRY